MTLQIKFASTTYRIGQRYHALNKSLKNNVKFITNIRSNRDEIEKLIDLYGSSFETLCSAMINVSQFSIC